MHSSADPGKKKKINCFLNYNFVPQENTKKPNSLNRNVNISQKIQRKKEIKSAKCKFILVILRIHRIN